MEQQLKQHQLEFMPEDTKAGQILDFLDRYKGDMVCSKMLYREALGHLFDEPRQWEIREINDIMNNTASDWKAFSNPRHFPEPYRRQRGWARVKPDNRDETEHSNFHELTQEEQEQLELPDGW